MPGDPTPDDAPISRFPIPEPAALPDDMKQAIEAAAAKAGFTPNVFLAYAWKPEHFRAFFQYYEALMRGESGLSRAEREMIVVAVSAVNSCSYCTVTHGAALRILSKNPHIADQITANYRHADLTARERAMLEFALKVTTSSAAIEAADLEAMRRHGFTDSEIWDIGAVAAFFNLSNRMANLAGMRPNREFYSMGRGQL
jgi:uncharacterized peroxidase-related enzyme